MKGLVLIPASLAFAGILATLVSSATPPRIPATAPGSQAAGPDARAEDIRKDYLAMVAGLGETKPVAKRLITGTDNWHPDDAGLTASSLGKDRVVSVRVGLSNRSVISTFFWRDGQLAMLVDRDEWFSYDEQSGKTDPMHVVATKERRYYLDKEGIFFFAMTGGPTGEELSFKAVTDAAGYFRAIAQTSKAEVDVTDFLHSRQGARNK